MIEGGNFGIVQINWDFDLNTFVFHGIDDLQDHPEMELLVLRKRRITSRYSFVVIHGAYLMT